MLSTSSTLATARAPASRRSTPRADGRPTRVAPRMAARVATRVATRALGGAYVALTPAQNHVAYSQVLAGTRGHTQIRAASALAANSRSFRTVLVATETYDEEMELGLDAAPSLGAGEGPAAEKQVKTYGPNARVTATGRILAIGDVHGDIQKLLDCLFVAGLIAQDADGIRWVGEDATVVQLGDVLDRGDAEISTVLLIRELDKQARLFGGAFHMLNGNHESLNVAGDFRYVTPGAFWESAMAAGLDEAEARRSNDAVLQARWALYRPGGVMAKELSQNPTVLIVNDEIVFAHGGLLPHHVEYGIQRINDEVARWMRGADCTDGSSPTPPFTAMGDSNSVMWNRTFGKERCSPYDRMHMKTQLDATLDRVGAKAMVVGHTPQMSGLNAECNGRIWRVDVGMSSGVLGAEAQVLEFSKDQQSGDLLATLLTRDASPYLKD